MKFKKNSYKIIWLNKLKVCPLAAEIKMFNWLIIFYLNMFIMNIEKNGLKIKPEIFDFQNLNRLKINNL